MSRRALAFPPPIIEPTARPAAPAAPASPYRDTQGAVDYLALKSQNALYTLMREHGLPYLRAGGRYRFDTRELDAWLRGTTALDLRRAGKK